MNYCESPKKNKSRSRPRGQQKLIADAREKIRVKSELITRKKKAIYILNREKDNRRIENLDDSDIEEYQDLIDDDNGVPSEMNDFHSEPIHDEETDECIIIESNSPRNIITTGVAPIEVDREFTCEYSFTTNVCLIQTEIGIISNNN